MSVAIPASHGREFHVLISCSIKQYFLWAIWNLLPLSFTGPHTLLRDRRNDRLTNSWPGEGVLGIPSARISA